MINSISHEDEPMQVRIVAAQGEQIQGPRMCVSKHGQDRHGTKPGRRVERVDGRGLSATARAVQWQTAALPAALRTAADLYQFSA